MATKITQRLLEGFRAVMHAKTVTGAAQMLHVSQPVVTRLISDLEERIGFVLFERERGRLQPTAEAKILYEEVQRSFIGIERIIQSVDEIRDLKRGNLQTAAAPAMSLFFLPRAIASFTATHPNAHIGLHMHSSGTVLDMVLGGRCDIGFAMLSMRHHGAHGEVLLSTKMVCALPTGHRLQGRSKIVPQDLANERFISQPPLLDVRLQIDSIFAAHGVTRQLHLETQISHSLIEFVGAGAGVSIVDPLTATDYQGDAVIFIPFEPVIVNDFSILTSSQRSPSLLQRPFIEHVSKSFKQYIDPSLILE